MLSEEEADMERYIFASSNLFVYFYWLNKRKEKKKIINQISCKILILQSRIAGFCSVPLILRAFIPTSFQVKDRTNVTKIIDYTSNTEGDDTLRITVLYLLSLPRYPAKI